MIGERVAAVPPPLPPSDQVTTREPGVPRMLKSPGTAASRRGAPPHCRLRDDDHTRMVRRRIVRWRDVIHSVGRAAYPARRTLKQVHRHSAARRRRVVSLLHVRQDVDIEGIVRREAAETRVIVVHGQGELAEVALAARAVGGLANFLHRRQQQPDQHADNGDDDEQLHQGKSAARLRKTEHAGSVLDGADISKRYARGVLNRKRMNSPNRLHPACDVRATRFSCSARGQPL